MKGNDLFIIYLTINPHAFILLLEIPDDVSNEYL